MTPLSHAQDVPSLDAQAAQQAVDLFVRAHDESYRHLAYYAAIPLLLTPELLNYLRNRFLRGQVPWVAEVDLLLSDLCRPVDSELYAMPAPIRAHLLAELRAQSGDTVLQEVARTLIHYVRHLARTNPFLAESEIQAQQWAAMVYLDDQRAHAARAIAQSFQSIAAQLQHTGLLAAGPAPRAELARLTRLTQTLAPDLQQHPELIEYAALISQILADDPTQQPRRQPNYRASVEGIELRLPDLIKQRNVGIRQEFLDFFIEVNNHSGKGHYIATTSPVGQTSRIISFPFSDNILKSYLYKLENLVKYQNRLSTNNIEIVQNFGQQLFSLLLQDESLNNFRASQQLAHDQGKAMRVILRVTSLELASLPWELLYDPYRRNYITLDAPFVRCLGFTEALVPLLISSPLRILSLAINPSDMPPVNLDAEQLQLENVLRPLIAQGLVDLTWVSSPTMLALEQWMQPDHGPWHIFHFAGYGSFSLPDEEGYIFLTDDSGGQQPISVEQLNHILTLQQNTLRLVVLNTSGASIGNFNLAQTLLLGGIPAVLFMQYDVADTAALQFARVFYEAFTSNLQVDIAVADARKALDRDSLNWCAPVLYMRSPASQLFQIAYDPQNSNKPEHETVGSPQPSTEQSDDSDAQKSAAILSDLRNLLSNLYPDEASRQRIVAAIDIAVDPIGSEVNDSTQSEPTWSEILNRAEKLNKISALLNIAIKEYPANQSLQSIAIDYHQHALHRYRQMSDQAGEVMALNNLGRIYRRLGEMQQALAYYTQAMSLMQQVGDISGVATTLNNLGSMYAALGDQQEALRYYTQALPLYQQIGDQAGEAATLHNLGLVYAALDEQQEALHYFGLALILWQQVGDQAGEAATLHNIGSVCADLGEQMEALHHYTQALPLYQQVGDQAGEATALHSIGLVCANLGRQEEALYYFTQALPLYQQVGDRGGEAAILHNLGRVYNDLDDKQEALRYYTQALLLYQAVGDHWGESATRSNLAKVYVELRRLAEAIAELEQVVAIEKALSHPDLANDRALLAQLQAMLTAADKQS